MDDMLIYCKDEEIRLIDIYRRLQGHPEFQVRHGWSASELEGDPDLECVYVDGVDEEGEDRVTVQMRHPIVCMLEFYGLLAPNSTEVSPIHWEPIIAGELVVNCITIEHGGPEELNDVLFLFADRPDWVIDTCTGWVLVATEFVEKIRKSPRWNWLYGPEFGEQYY